MAHWITRSIVGAIDLAIRAAEIQRVSRVRPDNLDAWDHVQQGWFAHFQYKKEANQAGRRHFEAAIDLDPQYAQAHAGLSFSHSLDVWLRWSKDLDAVSQKLAYEAAQTAITLDTRDAVAHVALSIVNYTRGRLDQVGQAADAALSLNPSLASAHMMAGAALIHGGDPAGGVVLLNHGEQTSWNPT